MQMGPNSSPLRTPSQCATGWGARHRRSPIGGAAKGIPLKTRMSGFVPEMPETIPLSSLTGASIAACSETAKIRARKNRVRIGVIISGLGGGEEVDTYGCQFGWRICGLEVGIRAQSCFFRAIEEHRDFDEILIRKSVSAVVGHGWGLIGIRSREFRRDRVKLHQQQAEATDVWRPAAQVAYKIFFELVRENFV